MERLRDLYSSLAIVHCCSPSLTFTVHIPGFICSFFGLRKMLEETSRVELHVSLWCCTWEMSVRLSSQWLFNVWWFNNFTKIFLSVLARNAASRRGPDQPEKWSFSSPKCGDCGSVDCCFGGMFHLRSIQKNNLWFYDDGLLKLFKIQRYNLVKPYRWS